MDKTVLDKYVQQWSAIQTVRAAGLNIDDIVATYVGLPGEADELDVRGYLTGLVMLAVPERNLVAQAINELLDSIGSMVDGAHYSTEDAASFSGYGEYLRTLDLSPDGYDFTAPPAGDHSTSAATSTHVPPANSTENLMVNPAENPLENPLEDSVRFSDALDATSEPTDDPMDNAMEDPVDDPGSDDTEWDETDLDEAELDESEFRRVQALHESGLLETGAEERFDRITRQARDHFGVSSASIALITEDAQVIKSVVGPIGQDLPRSMALCAKTIERDRTLVIADAGIDPQWQDHPLVTGGPRVRFYAGHPVCTAEGWRIGTLCLIDDRPRTFTQEDVQVLRRLAAQVQIEIWV